MILLELMLLVMQKLVASVDFKHDLHAKVILLMSKTQFLNKVGITFALVTLKKRTFSPRNGALK